MSEKESLDVQKAHRHFAVDCFNRCWDLIDKGEERSEEDNRRMLSLAMASRHHWLEFEGQTPANFVRSEWQVSRVLSLLGEGSLAMSHARSGLRCAEEKNVGAFDLAYIHEAVARAAMVLDDRSTAQEHVDFLLDAAKDIETEEDRTWLFEDGFSGILECLRPT